MPAAAKAHTPAGAEAFVRYFFDSVDRAYREPSDSAILPLCLANVPDCMGFQESATELVRDKQHYAARTIDLRSVEYGHRSGKELVEVHGFAVANKIVDQQGILVDTQPEVVIAVQYELKWTASGWRVAAGRKVVSK